MLIFAAKIVGGSPTQIVKKVIDTAGVSPQYKRVTRVGNEWTQAYSLDGTNWMVVFDG